MSSYKLWSGYYKPESRCHQSSNWLHCPTKFYFFYTWVLIALTWFILIPNEEKKRFQTNGLDFFVRNGICLFFTFYCLIWNTTLTNTPTQNIFLALNLQNTFIINKQSAEIIIQKTWKRNFYFCKKKSENFFLILFLLLKNENLEFVPK